MIKRIFGLDGFRHQGFRLHKIPDGFEETLLLFFFFLKLKSKRWVCRIIVQIKSHEIKSNSVLLLCVKTKWSRWDLWDFRAYKDLDFGRSTKIPKHIMGSVQIYDVSPLTKFNECLGF